MYAATEALKDAFNPNQGHGSRAIDWETRFAIVNNEAVAQTVTTAQEDGQISRMAQVMNGVETPLNLATFEAMGWPLNGSVVVPPKTTQIPTAEVGLIMPKLSDANGVYAEPQVFTATTQGTFNYIAITISWGHAIPADFTVQWFNGDTVVNEVAVSGNTSSLSLLNYPVEGCNKVVVTITKSLLPYRRCRIAEFTPGAVKVYNKNSANSAALVMNIDPLNERITAGTLKITADNFAKEFNIFQPDGVYAYFQERQKLSTQIGALQNGGSFAYVPMPPHYLKMPSLKGNMSKLDLEAVDRVGLLQDTIYTKGVYRYGTLASFVDEIAADCSSSILYPNSFYDLSLYAYIASMSHAQALRMIAQATNTFLTVSREDAVVFAYLGDQVLQTLTAADYRMNDGFSPSDDEIYNTVNLEVAGLSVENAVSELAKVPADGTIANTVFYVDNAVITTTAGQYSPSYQPSVNQTATVTNGELIIQGSKIINSNSVYSYSQRQTHEQAYIYEAGKSNPFITTQNAEAVARYLLDMKALRRRIVKLNYRGYPYLDMGDIIDFNTGGDNTQPFFITRNTLNLDGGMRGGLETRER